MSKVIAIVNQKGMTGKSTTAQCLAEELTKLGRNTSVITLDPMQLPDLMEVELMDDVQCTMYDNYIATRIKEIGKNMDFILLDTPSSLGRLTNGALSVADTVLIPIRCTAKATEGLTRLLSIIKLIKESTNAKLNIEGIFLTMFNAKLQMAPVIYNDLKRDFGELLLKTVIRKDCFEDYKALASELCQK